jgi:hypothetical protein
MAGRSPTLEIRKGFRLKRQAMPSKYYKLQRIHVDYLEKLKKLTQSDTSATSNTKMLHRLIDDALQAQSNGQKPLPHSVNHDSSDHRSSANGDVLILVFLLHRPACHGGLGSAADGLRALIECTDVQALPPRFSPGAPQFAPHPLERPAVARPVPQCRAISTKSRSPVEDHDRVGHR